MPIEEPRWWYGPASPILPAALQPLANVYGRIVVGRYRRQTPYRARLPVICIGNLVAGGTGKTPFALHVAQLLLARGDVPVFLSRGYGGARRGPHKVDPLRDTAHDVGDEPLLLARIAPTWIARDRAAAARLIEDTLGITEGSGRAAATHIIMDDGLQNPSLHKDLSFAVIDGDRWIGNGRVIPAGPLRAPLAFQAGLVDALVIGTTAPAAALADTTGTELGQLLPDGSLDPVLPDILVATFPVPVLSVARQIDGPSDWLRQRAWVAFAGIGRPDGFFDMLESAGAHLVARVPFADHQPLTDDDARRLLALADENGGAGLITTEKDRARLTDNTEPYRRLKARAQVLKLRLGLAPAHASKLQRLLDGLRRRIG